MTHRNERRTAFEHKRGVASPRLVRMLGADARLAQNDEPDEEIDRGPLTVPAELTDDAAFAAFDLARNVNKGERLAQRDADQAAALDLQQLDVMRRAGL